jgi:hypothetical protein
MIKNARDLQSAILQFAMRSPSDGEPNIENKTIIVWH